MNCSGSDSMPGRSHGKVDGEEKATTAAGLQDLASEPRLRGHIDGHLRCPNDFVSVIVRPPGPGRSRRGCSRNRSKTAALMGSDAEQNRSQVIPFTVPQERGVVVPRDPHFIRLVTDLHPLKMG
jgi:hypothetical protein